MRTMRLRQTEEKDYCKRSVVPLLVTISIELPLPTKKNKFFVSSSMQRTEFHSSFYNKNAIRWKYCMRNYKMFIK